MERITAFEMSELKERQNWTSRWDAYNQFEEVGWNLHRQPLRRFVCETCENTWSELRSAKIFKFQSLGPRSFENYDDASGAEKEKPGSDETI